MPDEQVTMLEQLRHTPLQPLDPPRLCLVRLAGATAFLLGDLCFHLLAELGQRPQHGLGDLHEYMETAYLVRHARPQLLAYLGVKRRAIRGDTTHLQAPFVQLAFELTQEGADVLVRRFVVEDAESQAVVAAVIDDGEDAAR